MDSTQDTTIPWNKKKWVHWLALVFVLPIYIFPVLRYTSTGGAFTLRDMFIYSGVICGVEIVVILLLQRYWIGESLSTLNIRSTGLWKDILSGLILGVVTLALSFITRGVLSNWLENETVSSMGGLFTSLELNPKLILWWLGPLILIGVSQEELTRVFTINRFFRIFPGPAGKWIAATLSALIFALAHLFEGLTGIIWAGLFGFIMGIYYIYKGRLLPMILAHYLNNAFNFAAILILIRQGTIQL